MLDRPAVLAARLAFGLIAVGVVAPSLSAKMCTDQRGRVTNCPPSGLIKPKVPEKPPVCKDSLGKPIACGRGGAIRVQ